MSSSRFVFVTGGVISGLGKGVVAASLGNLLKARGYKVFLQKFDPYLNVDAGTLNPAEHGECFVTSDGAEADLDLGHYERFLDIETTRDSSVMSGSIYQKVIDDERRGQFLGKTIQVIPHVTNEVKRRILNVERKSKAQIIITEIGGTIGDIESLHFVEAIRQFASERPGHCAFVHVGFLPYLEASGEIKTKPIQNSIIDLRERGIHPDMVFCRSDSPVSKGNLDKVALFGGLSEQAVIPLETAATIYAVPLTMKKYRADEQILKAVRLPIKPHHDGEWTRLVHRILKPRQQTLTVGLVGKYITMGDTYFSVTEALKAAAWTTPFKLEIKWIDAEKIEKHGVKILDEAKLDAICVPGGFGSRAIEGIIKAITYARTNNIPFLGLCLGLQLATIEYARLVLKIKSANSTEFINCKEPVIDLMDEQTKLLNEKKYGGTMRLGSYECELKAGTLARKLYKQIKIAERHRHRYEFNNLYRTKFVADSIFVLSGINKELNLVEMIELNNHPFFIACQFHPEFKSRPNRPHPLFLGLIKSAITHKMR